MDVFFKNGLGYRERNELQEQEWKSLCLLQGQWEIMGDDAGVDQGSSNGEVKVSWKILIVLADGLGVGRWRKRGIEDES